MPMPVPRKGEQHADFHHRCMGDATMNHDFSDEKQRNAVCFRQWEDHHGQQGALGGSPILAFTHNSTISDSAPDWGSVDKTALPRLAFADQGQPDHKSTWGFPHHWISGGTTKDENGIWTDGTMYLHVGGWQSAWNAAHGARSGQHASAEVIAHLERHQAAIDAYRQKQQAQAMPSVLPDTIECVRAHLGIWAMLPKTLQHMVLAYQDGRLPMKSLEMMAAERASGSLYTLAGDGVALVRIVGQITKGISKFQGGTSTVMTRRALRQAVAAEDVQSIMLAIDSPGGQVDGVQDLADEVRKASQQKPVAAYIEDLGASAAYWIASQAQRITANQMALVGSIGAFAVLEDISGAAQREGVSVRVVSTGAYKGMGVPGTPVTQDHLDETQRLVDQVGQFFFQAVRQGRSLTRDQLAAVTDGRLWMAADAQRLGLIDGIETFDAALAYAATMRPRRRPTAATAQAREQIARVAADLGLGSLT